MKVLAEENIKKLTKTTTNHYKYSNQNNWQTLNSMKEKIKTHNLIISNADKGSVIKY